MNTDVMIPETAMVSQKQADAWIIGLAQQKNMMAQALKNMELQAQAILLPVNKDSYKAIDEALAAYSLFHTTMIETRKPLTQAIDAGIIQPLMEFEKRVDPKVNEDYKELAARSLQLRNAEFAAVAKQKQKAQAISAFKTHVENELFAIANEWRWLLRNEARGQYEIALRAHLDPGTADIKKMIATLKPRTIAPFPSELLTREEKIAIYTSMIEPEKGEHFKEALLRIYNEEMKAMDDLFLNFDSDVANAEAAIEFQRAAEENKQLIEQETLQREQAMTKIVNAAETPQFVTPTIKKNLEVEVENTQGWACATIAAFVTNLPNLREYIRVKTWSNLTVGQMADALGKFATKTGTVFNKLKLKEVQK